jgi:two-component system, cell cycle sensor histidine kinase and response regulator CckA
VDLEQTARVAADLAPGRYVVLEIADTGCGMDEAIQAQIFEPFYTTKGAGKGTGLGLSTCYGIIKQSGGAIVVKSRVGAGSTFQVYLPQVEKRDPFDFADAAPKLKRGQGTILLVEDELMVRRLQVRALKKQGYVVLEASNGEEALRKLEEVEGGTVDLVVSDVVMPRMGGLELLEHLKQSNPDLQVLLTSGYVGESVRLEDAGEIEFLPKPFTPTEFSRKVAELLEGT